MGQRDHRRRGAAPPTRTVSRRTNFINQGIKYALFFFNFIFWLAGSGILVIGIIATLMKKDAFAHGTGQVDDVFDIIFDVTLVFIIFGGIIFCLTFAGFLGSLRENVCLLKFFAISLFIIFLIECSAAIAVFVLKDKVIDYIEQVLKNNMITKYREDRYEDTRNFIDWYQKNLECCGAKIYRDWNENVYFSCQANNTSPEQCGVPFSCCKKPNNIENDVINTMCGYGVQRESDTVVAGRIWTTGCVESTKKFIEANVFPVAGVAIGVAAVQLTAIFLSRVLAGQIQDQVTLLKRTGELRTQRV